MLTGSNNDQQTVERFQGTTAITAKWTNDGSATTGEVAIVIMYTMASGDLLSLSLDGT